jgi:Clostripain family
MSGQTQQSSQAKWTFMVYLAGDNNLEDFGDRDLAEMKCVGSGPRLDIAAQFDRMSDNVTRRYHLTHAPSLQDDCVQELPEINTGDPAALSAFITWAMDAYPADRFALVLWNHGAGWKDDDVYKAAARCGPPGQPAASPALVRRVRSARSGRVLFSTSVAELLRAILFDDSSADFLDNREMKQVLAEAVARIGRPIDLLGFDACLMNMLEVVYQVRDQSRVVVGSQEIEPGDGWPYDRILAALATNPDMDAEALGRCIVPAYVDYYRERSPAKGVTQSAIRTSAVGPVCEATSDLAEALLPLLDSTTLWGRLSKVQRDVQRFTDREYVDLHHLADLLAKSDKRGKPGKAARALVKVLSPPTTPIITEAHLGSTMQHATGLSIYLPSPRGLSPLYATLDFAHDYSWSAFLNAYVGAI